MRRFISKNKNNVIKYFILKFEYNYIYLKNLFSYQFGIF